MATIERRQGKRGISFRVEWRHDGERHRLTYDNEQDAIEWKALIEAAGGDQKVADRAILNKSSTAPRLSEVADEHIGRLIDVTPYTKTKYRTHLEHHLGQLDIPVDRISSDDIARWVAWMHNDAPVRGGDKSGYSPKTIKNAHGFLASVMGYAVRRGYRVDNPAMGTRLPKLTPGDDRDKFLTVEEFSVLAGHIESRYQSYALFLFGTGLRAGEFLALTPEDFTVVDGVTYVSITKAMKRDATGPGTYVGEPKTPRARRRIDVEDSVMESVWPLVRSAGHGKPIFTVDPVQESTVLSRRMWTPAVKRARKVGFTKDPGLHALRHSHASHLLALGMPMHEVSRRLGHESTATTDKIYAHMVPARQGAASRLMKGSIPALPAATFTGQKPALGSG